MSFYRTADSSIMPPVISINGSWDNLAVSGLLVLALTTASTRHAVDPLESADSAPEFRSSLETIYRAETIVGTEGLGTVEQAIDRARLRRTQEALDAVARRLSWPFRTEVLAALVLPDVDTINYLGEERLPNATALRRSCAVLRYLNDAGVTSKNIKCAGSGGVGVAFFCGKTYAHIECTNAGDIRGFARIEAHRPLRREFTDLDDFAKHGAAFLRSVGISAA